MTTLTPELARHFVDVALGHVAREYPNKLDHVLSGPADARTPRDLHPVFYGSFDWHSCVHGYWMLAHLYRRFPAMPNAPAIRALFDTHLTAANIEAECAYLRRPAARGFERPYGWAWLLKLAAELDLHEDRTWSNAVAPLAAMFVDRFTRFLPLATYPIRAGVHTNTAFAIRLAFDYPHAALRDLLAETAPDTARRSVMVEIGLPDGGLLARVTADAVVRLELAPGVPVLALIKSTSIEVLGS